MAANLPASPGISCCRVSEGHILFASMYLERFRNKFSATAQSQKSRFPASDFGVPGLSHVLEQLGGTTLNHGWYRVLRSDQVMATTKALEDVFPEYRGRVVAFGFDWLGRHFAHALGKDEPTVLGLEVGAGEAMVIPGTVLEFHNEILINDSDAALAEQFWNEWRIKNPADVEFSKCVGYKVPLFLGGTDVVGNLEVYDLELYVNLCGQLRNKVRKLRPGQSIGSIAFQDPLEQ
jgi:hypothetical protein